MCERWVGTTVLSYLASYLIAAAYIPSTTGIVLCGAILDHISLCEWCCTQRKVNDGCETLLKATPACNTNKATIFLKLSKHQEVRHQQSYCIIHLSKHQQVRHQQSYCTKPLVKHQQVRHPQSYCTTPLEKQQQARHQQSYCTKPLEKQQQDRHQQSYSTEPLEKHQQVRPQ